MVQDNPYNPYPDYDGTHDIRFYNKPGILGAWKSRALQYMREKDPWKTFNTVDENKFHWTLQNLWDDPVGTVIGRDVLTEEQIEDRLRNKDKEDVAMMVKKESDYFKIMPVDGSEKGGSYIKEPQTLEKSIVHARILNSWQEPMEVEGESHYERRTVFDLNYFLHKGTLGHYKYDPYESRSAAPGRIGYPGGNQVIEKPISGPNIRGRYARDLRGDKDVLYEFTNTSDMSHLGSDLGSAGFSSARAHGRSGIKNKFLGKESLSD